MNLSSRRQSIRYEITFHFIVRGFVVKRGTWRLFENICLNFAVHGELETARKVAAEVGQLLRRVREAKKYRNKK